MNFKNQLQELCQKRRLGIPKYESDSFGESHRPVVVVRVRVTWDNGEELVEEARAEGKKRKEVEKMAAHKMYQRILETKLGGVRPTPSVSPPPPLSSWSAPQSSPPMSSLSISVKNELQEMLQKSVHNLPPPLYEDVPANHRGEFTSKVTVRGKGGEVLAQEYGYGKTKKESETNAARTVIPIMKKKLESGDLMALSALRGPSRPSETLGIVDPDVDSSIDAHLLEFSPCYDYRPGIDGLKLCLARASNGVTAHGLGKNEYEATMDAKLNLHHCLQSL